MKITWIECAGYRAKQTEPPKMVTVRADDLRRALVLSMDIEANRRLHAALGEVR